MSVTDSQNRFRSFLDILGDLALSSIVRAKAQRSAFLLSTFGREALGSVNAILTQVTNGVRTNSGETLRGAATIAYLRDQFENAGARRASASRCSTPSRAEAALAGSLETLAIVAGEPFAQVFKPLVTIVVEVVNAVLNVFRQLPAPVKRAFAAFVVGAGAVVALVGAVIAAKAGFALLLIGLKAAGITLGGLMATILPAILIFGVLAAVVAGFVVAFETTSAASPTSSRACGTASSSPSEGLVQLFEQGGFSGAVREELNRAENAGLKTFLIRVYQIAFRIQRFFRGIGGASSAAIEATAPVFEAFVGALTRLGGRWASSRASRPMQRRASRPTTSPRSAASSDRSQACSSGLRRRAHVRHRRRHERHQHLPLGDGAASARVRRGEERGPSSSRARQARRDVRLHVERQRPGGRLARCALRSVAEFLGTVIGYVAAGIAGAIGVMVSFVVNRLAVIIAAFRSVVGFIGGVVDILRWPRHRQLGAGGWASEGGAQHHQLLAQLLLGFVKETIAASSTPSPASSAPTWVGPTRSAACARTSSAVCSRASTKVAGVTVAPAGSTLTALDAATSRCLPSRR